MSYIASNFRISCFLAVVLEQVILIGTVHIMPSCLTSATVAHCSDLAGLSSFPWFSRGQSILGVGLKLGQEERMMINGNCLVKAILEPNKECGVGVWPRNSWLFHTSQLLFPHSWIYLQLTTFSSFHCYYFVLSHHSLSIASVPLPLYSLFSL